MELYEYLYGAYSAAARIKLEAEGWIQFQSHIEHIDNGGNKTEVIIYHFKRQLK